MMMSMTSKTQKFTAHQVNFSVLKSSSISSYIFLCINGFSVFLCVCTVYESSAVRGGVTGKPKSLSHAGETNVPASEEIVPPGTKVFPVVSSDHTKPIEPVSLQDTSYGHEALADPVRTTETSDWEAKREAPTHYPLGVSEFSDRGESREAHQEPLNTPVSLLSATEDVTRTFAPGGEDDYLGGQRKVNVETPKRLEEDPAAPGGGSDYLSGVSNYQSKVTDPTHKGNDFGRDFF